MKLTVIRSDFMSGLIISTVHLTQIQKRRQLVQLASMFFGICFTGRFGLSKSEATWMMLFELDWHTWVFRWLLFWTANYSKEKWFIYLVSTILFWAILEYFLKVWFDLLSYVATFMRRKRQIVIQKLSESHEEDWHVSVILYLSGESF